MNVEAFRLLSSVPIESLFMCHNFDLTPYGIDAWCSTIRPYRLAIFLRTKPDAERKAIQVQIPTFDIKHPEKIEATKFSMFNVLEYTKHKAYTSTEIDWKRFKSNFVEACLELKKHCASCKGTQHS